MDVVKREMVMKGLRRMMEGRSGVEVARELGVSQSGLNRVMNGKRRGGKLLERVAAKMAEGEGPDAF